MNRPRITRRSQSKRGGRIEVGAGCGHDIERDEEIARGSDRGRLGRLAGRSSRSRHSRKAAERREPRGAAGKRIVRTTTGRPPPMLRGPTRFPLSRTIGAKPARAAMRRRSSCPSSGIPAITVAAAIGLTSGAVRRCQAMICISASASTRTAICASISAVHRWRTAITLVMSAPGRSRRSDCAAWSPAFEFRRAGATWLQVAAAERARIRSDGRRPRA